MRHRQTPEWKEIVEDSLSSSSIIHNLETQFIGQSAVYYPSVTSTMEVAKQEFLRGATEGTVIVAGEQREGHGRMKRTWLSPQGSISLSVILRPTLGNLPSLMMLSSLAVVHSIESVTSLKPRLKWPNDVLINGRKVAGILIESNIQNKNVRYAIIGIGINVNITLSDFPELSASATSLSDELGVRVSPSNLIRKLLIELERLYVSLPVSDALFREWRESLVTLGKAIQVKSGDTLEEGIAESVTRDGNLLLRRPDGSIIRIVAGDATLRT